MKNLILLIFILSTTSVNASVKSQIISNLISTENLKFQFQQKINEKIETGNCIISYPKKIFCKYDDFYEKGTYHCAGCDEPLYKSDHKYNSYCGWPSFDREISDKLEYDVDYKLGYPRTEIKCKKCGGHLGHVFNDGPKETTGIRHCVNSVALVFKKHDKER